MQEAKQGWRVQLLGSPQLLGEGAPQRLDRKMAGVLAYVALSGATPRSVLREHLWPDSTPERARTSLRQTLHRLRTLAPVTLLQGEDVLRLAEGVQVDVLEAGRGSGTDLDGGELLHAYDYGDCPDFDAWLQVQRQRLEGIRQRGLLERVAALEEEGQLQRALALVEEALSRAPTDEAWDRRGMRLYYLLGEPAAARGLYQRCVRVLEQVLQTAPSEETVALSRSIERGTLASPKPARPRRTPLPVTALRPPVLAGRAREWELMERAWEAGQLIFVSGEPGVGKSRLVRDFVASRGSYCWTESRPGDAHVPLASYTRHVRRLMALDPALELPDWVRRELARVLPELAVAPDPSPPPRAGSVHRQRFLDAQLQVWCRALEAVSGFVVDDLQFGDHATNDIGEYIYSHGFPLGRPGGLPASALIFRSGELRPATAAVVHRMVDAGVATHLQLERLSDAAVGEMLEGLGLPGVSRHAAAIGRYTGGNPLFIVETVKHLVERGGMEPDWPERLPPPGKVRLLIEARLQQLSQGAQQLAQVAALAATSFDLDLAAAVLETPVLSLDAPLRELESAQVLRDGRFVHDVLAEAVGGAIPQSLRIVLHRRMASYWESTGAAPSLVAHHWEAAEERARAIPQLLRAALGEEAALRPGEAASHLEDAARLLEASGRAAEAAACLRRAAELAREVTRS